MVSLIAWTIPLEIQHKDNRDVQQEIRVGDQSPYGRIVYANQSFEPRKSDMVSEKVPFQVPVSEIRV